MVESVLSPSEAHLLFDKVIKMAEKLQVASLNLTDDALHAKLREAEEALFRHTNGNKKGEAKGGLLRSYKELNALLFELWDRTRKQEGGDKELAQEYYERMKAHSDIIKTLTAEVEAEVGKLPVSRYR